MVPSTPRRWPPATTWPGILQAQGRLTAAEAEYRLVRKARIDTLGPDHPNTLLITRRSLRGLCSAP